MNKMRELTFSNFDERVKRVTINRKVFMNMKKALKIFALVFLASCSSVCSASQISFNLSSSSDSSPPADSVLSYFGPPLTTRWAPDMGIEDRPNINEPLTKETKQKFTKIGQTIASCDKICQEKTKNAKRSKRMYFDKETGIKDKSESNILGGEDEEINDRTLFSSETIKVNNISHTYLRKVKEGKRQYNVERKRYLPKQNYKNDILFSRHRHRTFTRINDFGLSVPIYPLSYFLLPTYSSFYSPIVRDSLNRRSLTTSTKIIATQQTNFIPPQRQQTNITKSPTMSSSSHPSLWPHPKLNSFKSINASGILSSSLKLPSSVSGALSTLSISSSPASSLTPYTNSSLIMAHDEASSEVQKTRVNVVDENPSLDVGPLVLLTVAENSVARLPCSQTPLSIEDSVRLILWYRNDTSRPLLSYDARESQKPRKSDIFERSKEAFQRRDFVLILRSKWMENEPRISLGRGGESLILLKVRNKDQAEYRCTVHYKELPSVTYRLQLLVTDKIADVNIYDPTGIEVAGNYGPFSEGSELFLSCKGNCSTKSASIKSLNWLIGEDDLWSEWEKVNNLSGVSNLRLKLAKTHAEKDLTCRLTCEHQRFAGSVRTTIIDKSVGLNMLYVPQVRLFIDGASSKSALWNSEGPLGGGLEVLEMEALTFVCLVRSSPKAYNVTWMKDGQHLDLSNKSWLHQNGTLIISKVHQTDSGLYTCVASNSEGDGQSNAVNIRVAYPPYCKGPNNKHFTIGRNSSIVLQCNVNAYPSNVTFSWRRTNAYPIPKSNFDNSLYASKNSNIDRSRNGGHPEFIGLIPDNVDDVDKDRWRNFHSPQGPPLPHYEDPKMPTRSLLTLVPDAEHVGIVCLSRNNVGRTRDPCHFRISVVDSPSPPIGCHVNSVGISSLKVECKLKASGDDLSPSEQTPGLSPVRSPGIKGASVLEVWSMGTLLTNLTSDRGHWHVSQLPPDTDLRLRIYSLSSHVPSEPVVLFAKTLPKEQKRSKVNEVAHPSDLDEEKDTSSQESVEEATHLLILIGGILLGLSFLFLVTLGLLLGFRALHRRRQRRRREESNTESEAPECSIGEGDPWSIQNSYPDSYDTIATSPL